MQQEEHWTCQALYFGMMLDDVSARNTYLRDKYLTCCETHSLTPVPADFQWQGFQTPPPAAAQYQYTASRSSDSDRSVSCVSDYEESSSSADADAALEDGNLFDDELFDTTMLQCFEEVLAEQQEEKQQQPQTTAHGWSGQATLPWDSCSSEPILDFA